MMYISIIIIYILKENLPRESRVESSNERKSINNGNQQKLKEETNEHWTGAGQSVLFGHDTTYLGNSMERRKCQLISNWFMPTV